MESFCSYLPHSNKQLWEKAKISLTKEPKDIKDINNIFFKGKCDFFDKIDKYHKKEGEEFFKVYKNLQNLALDLENLFPEDNIPLLQKGTEDKYELTRKQIALLFLLSFFNLIDLTQEEKRETNSFSVFQVLLSSNGTTFEFGRCFLNYLTIIGKWLWENNKILDEKIRYYRSKKTLDTKNLDKNVKLCDIQIFEEGSLFDGKTSYIVDFANMFIGGGVLQGGCVQEEILFAIEPEAIVSMFFMEVMDVNDAIRIDNTIQYSNYTGYGFSFQFNGSAITDNNLDKIKKNNKILAIDACIQKTERDGSINIEEIERDIQKAYSGFMLVHYEKEENNEEKSISTGNWGCGAFDGDHELKFFQQWIAASFAGIKRLDYYTFKDDEMLYIISKFNRIKEKYTKAYKLYKVLTTKKLFSGKVVKIVLKESGNEDENSCSLI